MKTVDIINGLRALEAPEPDEARVGETLARCRMEYARRRRLRRVGAWELIRRQLRFTALPVWSLQGVLLILICAVLGSVRTRELALPGACLAAELAALTLLPFCGRARRYGMEEIETAARLSRAKLTLARLGAIGAGDAVCVAAAALISGGGWYEVLAFVVTPFLLTSAISLAALGHAGRESGVYIAAALGALLAVCCMTAAARWELGLLCLSPALAALICVTAAAALVAEIRGTFSEKRLEKGLGYEY